MIRSLFEVEDMPFAVHGGTLEDDSTSGIGSSWETKEMVTMMFFVYILEYQIHDKWVESGLKHQSSFFPAMYSHLFYHLFHHLLVMYIYIYIYIYIVTMHSSYSNDLKLYYHLLAIYHICS